MANRRNYYFRQFVSESELDAGFDGLEQADFNLAVDSDVAAVALSTTKGGILDGLTITNSGLLDAIVATGFCYDSSGRRINLPSDTTVVLSATGSTEIGLGGVPTGGSSTVPSSGSRRWVSLFLAFDRKLSDVREDGSGATIYFKSDESFYFYVAMGSQAVNPTNLPDLESDKILLGDFRVTYNGGAGGIDAISYDRRQVWLKAVDSGSTPTTRTDTVAGGGIPNTDFPVRGFDEQDGIRETLKKLLGYYNDHVRTDGKSTDQHSVSSITFSPYKWLTSTNIQAVIQEFVDDLESELVTGDGPGAGHIGNAAITSILHVSYDIAANTLEAQLAAIQQRIDTYCLDLSGYAGTQTVADAVIVNSNQDGVSAIKGVGYATASLTSIGVKGEGGTATDVDSYGVWGVGNTTNDESDSVGVLGQGGNVTGSGAGRSYGIKGSISATLTGTGIGIGVYGLGKKSTTAAGVGVWGDGQNATDYPGTGVRGEGGNSTATSVAGGYGGYFLGGDATTGNATGGIGLYAKGGSYSGSNSGGWGIQAVGGEGGGDAVEALGDSHSGVAGDGVRGRGGNSTGDDGGCGGRFWGGDFYSASEIFVGAGVWASGGDATNGNTDGAPGVYGAGGTRSGSGSDGPGIYGVGGAVGGAGVYGIGGSSSGVGIVGQGVAAVGGMFTGASVSAAILLTPRDGTPSVQNNGDVWIDYNAPTETVALRYRVNGTDYKVTATAV
jgi:hypothetical protein